jgi:hypothetical protein
MKDAVLIRDMGVDGHSPIIIAEIARIERAKQRTGLEAEALSIRGGAGPIAPHRTERQAVMEVDQQRIRGFERVLPQAPLGHLLEHVGRNLVLDTVGHGGDAQIRAVGDESG